MPVTDYIGLLIQVPLVGIFVWFALQLVRLFNDTITKRDDAWRVFLEQQEEASRSFLKQNADASTAAIQQMTARFADEIRNLTKEITELRRRNGNNKQQ